ncbi:MAG: RloB family protein [Bacteroidales bacterium]|nr:RloB family protein [Bacteroidales bacterium]
MILTNRLFTRRPPSREAKSIYIFCEGVKREYQYFLFFKEIDSRINIEIYPLKPNEDNSPQGLYKIACDCILKTKQNPNPKYELINGDEVWIVLDTDVDESESRKPQINKLRENCKQINWNVVQSNPCFEVWLYYHFFKEKPLFDGDALCKGWKPLLDEKGGFDSRKHPILIQTATENSESNFIENEGLPAKGTTELFRLSKSILPIVKEKINNVLTIL